MDACTEIQKHLYKEEEEKGRHPPAFLQHMGSGLHVEKGCRKLHAVKVFEKQTNFMEAKETCGDGCNRNYANS
jgi:hypothetical protein